MISSDRNLVLVVEDEPTLVPILRQALEESGYQTIAVGSGREGVAELNSGRYLLVVLDLMLPGIDGFEVITRTREAGLTLPILVLSARNRVDDKIRALDLGADDYLPKPFKTAELLARVRALLRRSGTQPATIQVADLVLDPEARTVRRGDRPIALSPKEFALLELLMRHTGKPVSKETLLKRIWPGRSFETDNIIEVYIGYLRQKLEELGQKRLIMTVRGRGYAIGDWADG